MEDSNPTISPTPWHIPHPWTTPLPLVTTNVQNSGGHRSWHFAALGPQTELFLNFEGITIT